MKSLYYTNVNKKISEGDRLDFDGNRGTVRKIVLAHTEAAFNYSCEDTGGILIDYDEYGLTLEPFGYTEKVLFVGCDSRKTDP